jgi:hypothetical protein
MKKMIVITLIAMLSLTMSGMAYAANATTTILGFNSDNALLVIGSSTAVYKSTLLGNSLYSPSTNVMVKIGSSLNGGTYCGASQHLSAVTATSGKQFATSSADPAIRETAATANGPDQCDAP